MNVDHHEDLSVGGVWTSRVKVIQTNCCFKILYLFFILLSERDLPVHELAQFGPVCDSVPINESRLIPGHIKDIFSHRFHVVGRLEDFINGNLPEVRDTDLCVRENVFEAFDVQNITIVINNALRESGQTFWMLLLECLTNGRWALLSWPVQGTSCWWIKSVLVKLHLAIGLTRSDESEETDCENSLHVWIRGSDGDYSDFLAYLYQLFDWHLHIPIPRWPLRNPSFGHLFECPWLTYQISRMTRIVDDLSNSLLRCWNNRVCYSSKIAPRSDKICGKNGSECLQKKIIWKIPSLLWIGFFNIPLMKSKERRE